MAKSSPSASSLRNREDESGYQQNSEVQADSGQASRGLAIKTPLARRAQKRLEAHFQRKGNETRMWEFRCAELGVSSWTRRIGPSMGWNMARSLAASIDQDEARVIAFGGKSYVMELRLHGSSRVERYEITGYPVWKYVANRLKEDLQNA